MQGGQIFVTGVKNDWCSWIYTYVWTMLRFILRSRRQQNNLQNLWKWRL